MSLSVITISPYAVKVPAFCHHGWMDGWMDGWKMDMWVDKWMSIWMAQGVEPSSNNCRVRGSNTSCCSLHLVLVKDTEPQTVLSVWFEWMIIDEQLAPCITMSSILKFMFLSVQPFLFCFLLWCLTLLFFQSPLPCLFLTTVIVLFNRIFPLCYLYFSALIM